MWDEELPGPIANSTITYAVNGRQYLAVYTGDGQLTAGVVAYNKDSKSARKMNTIQVFALPEDVAKSRRCFPRRRLRERLRTGKADNVRGMARLLSVNVGLPRDIEWKGRTVHTGIWKDPVRGRCRVGRLNLDGDGQGDLAGHGGEQRAVFVYQIESYRYWQEQLKRTDFVHGQFGENFTIEGLPDDAVCIGDRYQIGSALFEVTQPRVTCYRVGIRMNEPRMPALLTSSGRPGFYFRVLQEGEVGAGDEIVKVGEAKERMTVAEINALLYSPNHPRDRLERALRIEALSPGWRCVV